ncbi:DUF3809 family protein [Thermus thermamylovorans]|uniref:DUF3809 domain-containing protein n=1 Tax=Thermus thermamylovorans TaxID=2509362 RepID=A0A4Q9B5Y3_9DEIN|nr:DUF3809 family protein [Thermus thermamylovorans]TBH21046.1 DUF3809 domain-containing protein [Thermus thermamylovorans]
MKARLRLTLNGHAPQGLPLEVRLEGPEVRGLLRQESPALGEVRLPFRARLEGERLVALPLPPPCLWVEGWARPTREGLELELEVALVLPPGQSWGERAFGRILEALLLRALEALSHRSRSPV